MSCWSYTNSVLNREFGSTSRLMRTENVQHQDVVKQQYGCLETIQRVTGRKDVP
jgi:hypothetical protein